MDQAAVRSDSVPAAPILMAASSAERALEALAWINGQLAAARSLEPSLHATLEHLREVLGADAVAIWIDTPVGLTCGWACGTAVPTAADVEAALAPSDPAASVGTAAMPIIRGDRRVGVIAWRRGRPLEPCERLLLTAVAGLLALELTHEERSQRLEVEVAARAEEIERSRRFTETILDSLPVDLYVVDREYRIQTWNRRREAGVPAIPREAALGRPLAELLDLAEDDPVRVEIDEVFRTGRIVEYQRESAVSGETRTYRVSRVPMRVGTGTVTHVITIGEDVTDWTQAQARFAQADKLAAIGQLVAGVMHEVNNPLATIAACAESLGYRMETLVAAGVPDAQNVMDYLGIIGNEVHRCKRIVDGLLDYSRPRVARKERVQLNEVVERTLFLLKHHVRFRHVVAEVALDPVLGRVPHASAEQLVQVLMALLLNAMDAIDGEGTVRVITRVGPRTAEGAILEVIDEGPGIPAEALARIFEPFYTTKDPGAGTGLGLAVAYAIVHDHGGRLEVESLVGRGSTFRVVLPVIAA